ncbi:ATP-binding protein [Subtercola endophyticus]|uniref:ATP-binding protein n=1 Tax=Subtercola endophyticus TaxID=2895559 RepID=UPI001E3E56F3|nr:ATP-binding protein [Subtercola endophyticus]UFS59059.1 ATP-binding protein [Subtercola endophyticus]
MTASIAARARGLGQAIECQGDMTEARALNEMGFFRALEKSGSVGSQEFDPTGSYIPLKAITDNKNLTEFVTDFVPLLHTSAETANTVKYVLFELIRNVLEHSGIGFDAYAAASVSNDGRILIGVSDSGMGITQSIRQSHRAVDDHAAVKLAMTPGISGVTAKYGGDETNGGAGLFFMKALATLAKQRMLVLSGHSLMQLEPQLDDEPQLHPDLSDDVVVWTSLDAPFFGTAVGVDLKVEDSVAFDTLMSEIRKVYDLNVRTQKRARHKARFS